MKVNAYKISPKDNILLINGLIQNNESDLDVEEFVIEFFDQFVIFRKTIECCDMKKIKILPITRVNDNIQFNIKFEKNKILTNFISTFSKKEVSFRGKYIINIEETNKKCIGIIIEKVVN